MLEAFAQLEKLGANVASFITEAKGLLESIRTEVKEMREQVTRLEGAHEMICGWLADLDEEAEHAVAETAAVAAATAAEAASTAVAAAATVEAAAATVAEAVEETAEETEEELEVTGETPNPTPPAETPPAEPAPPAEPPAEPVPPAAPPASATPPERQKRRHFI